MSEGEGRDVELFRCWRVWREEDLIVGRGGRWRGEEGLGSDVGGDATDDDDDGDAGGRIGKGVEKGREGESRFPLSSGWPGRECINSGDRKLPPDGTRSMEVEVAAEMDG